MPGAPSAPISTNIPQRMDRLLWSRWPRILLRRGTGSGDPRSLAVYGKLIESSATSGFYGYVLGAGMMLVGALVELFQGVKAEGRSLESIARLSRRRRSDEPNC